MMAALLGPSRALFGGLGTLLLGVAVVAWPRRSGARSVSSARRGRGGLLLLGTCSVAARVPILRRASDASSLATRLAIAPDCWVARWIGAGLSAWHGRAAVTAIDPGNPPELASLAAGVRLLCGLCSSAIACAAALPVAGPTHGVLVAAAAFAVGMVLPDVSLGTRSRGGSRQGMSGAAAAVDLLAATASAGLSLPEAMVLTGGHAPPAVAAVLRAAAVRRAMGENPQSALDTEARRFGVPVLADVAQAVERQRRLGVELGPELAGIAARLRSEQRARSLQRAARRAPLGTLIVALVIVPVCVAAVIACVVGGLVQGGELALH
jgi:hypothetical protein